MSKRGGRWFGRIRLLCRIGLLELALLLLVADVLLGPCRAVLVSAFAASTTGGGGATTTAVLLSIAARRATRRPAPAPLPQARVQVTQNVSALCALSDGNWIAATAQDELEVFRSGDGQLLGLFRRTSMIAVGAEIGRLSTLSE